MDALALNAGVGAGGAFVSGEVKETYLQMSKDDPADVARDGFEAMMAGRESVVSASVSTKAQGRFDRFLPERLKSQMHRKMAEPGSARR